ncbi:hypothetical protein BSSC8_22080 [Bacillus subtilis subsp. subtilis str. SC-8]|nr:hypothetical protein BSSC8_22080 [Bacillus subtilis subsp. subtilis str. SC-8]
MPGEDYLQIPDYECCSDCGMTEMEIAEQKNKLQEAQNEGN